MLCVVIKGPSLEEIESQIQTAKHHADLIELRLDLFSKIDIEHILSLKDKFSLPMIFTLRSKDHGGLFEGSKEEYLTIIKTLITLEPQYLDVEFSVPFEWIEDLRFNYPRTKLILSYHNFVNASYSDKDLDVLYEKMQKIPAHFYKIAISHKTVLDVLRFILWARKWTHQFIPISMGTQGTISRILAPFIAAPITYCCLEDKNSLGQLSAKTLTHVYHYKTVSSQTSLYALIGSHIDNSVSDIRHNYVFKKNQMDALYLKMNVAPSELEEFLSLAKQIPLKGLSVTMPLKEAILPYLDKIDSAALSIGAVNTLVLEDESYSGYNTDGKGALDAIESILPVSEKKILILGAGGAAKAIVFEAIQRNAKVIICNRDENKAKLVSKAFHCDFASPASIEGSYYDIIINCTPVDMPISLESLPPKALVMDIKNRPILPFLTSANQKGSLTLSGEPMFLNQALLQYLLWFKSKADITRMKIDLFSIIRSFTST